jgi:hypothetical protein
MTAVQSFLVGRHICDALVSEFKLQHQAKQSYAFNVHYNNGVETDFECVELHPKSSAAKTVFEIIKKHVSCTECSTMRLHRLDKNQYLTPHTDSYYAGHQTILILLNQKGAGRFKIRRRPYQEKPFHATVFPVDTIHETTRGAGVRYTLVAWVR